MLTKRGPKLLLRPSKKNSAKRLEIAGNNSLKYIDTGASHVRSNNFILSDNESVISSI